MPPLTRPLVSKSKPSRNIANSAIDNKKDTNIAKLEKLETEREKKQQNATKNNNNNKPKQEESGNEAIFTSYKKVNLSTKDKKPSRKHLAKLLNNSYPHKYRKPTSVTNPHLTPEQISTTYR
jgi:hypothetical protein